MVRINTQCGGYIKASEFQQIRTNREIKNTLDLYF